MNVEPESEIGARLILLLDVSSLLSLAIFDAVGLKRPSLVYP